MRSTLLAIACVGLYAPLAHADDFTRGVERYCEVYIYSFPHGELECRGDFRFLQRECEAYFYDDENGELECRSDFRFLESQCTVYRYDTEYAEIDC